MSDDTSYTFLHGPDRIELSFLILYFQGDLFTLGSSFHPYQCKKEKLMDSPKAQGLKSQSLRVGVMRVEYKAEQGQITPNSISLCSSPNPTPLLEPVIKEEKQKKTKQKKRIRSKEQGTKVICEFNSNIYNLLVFALFLMEVGDLF